MKRFAVVSALAALVVTAVVSVAAGSPPPGLVAGPARGLVPPHEAHGNGGGGHKPNANMTYHGGPIMPSATIQAIFWGPSWSNSSFVGDKITGIHDFYTGFSNSNYAKTSDEYTGSNGQVGATTSYIRGVTDLSNASGGGSTTAILAEVQKEVTAGQIILDPAGNNYIPVYTDLPRGNAGYCAWHSSGTVTTTSGTTVVEFGFFWKLDGDPGCDPGDTSTGHSEGLAALANVSAHELSEARTDPASPGAWYDQQGEENGDKCAWTFNVPSVSFTNGTSWKLQGEWSNAAYNGGSGYPNSSGQRGCLDGH